MNYIIDPKVFSAVFTVPAAVADKHLKLARGEHIKVLLYIMRNMSVNPDNAEIAAAAGLSEYEVEEALLLKEEYRARVAGAIARGIAEYLQKA